jgi:hypothetical protein
MTAVRCIYSAVIDIYTAVPKKWLARQCNGFNGLELVVGNAAASSLAYARNNGYCSQLRLPTP